MHITWITWPTMFFVEWSDSKLCSNSSPHERSYPFCRGACKLHPPSPQNNCAIQPLSYSAAPAASALWFLCRCGWAAQTLGEIGDEDSWLPGGMLRSSCAKSSLFHFGVPWLRLTNTHFLCRCRGSHHMIHPEKLMHQEYFWTTLKEFSHDMAHNSDEAPVDQWNMELVRELIQLLPDISSYRSALAQVSSFLPGAWDNEAARNTAWKLRMKTIEQFILDGIKEKLLFCLHRKTAKGVRPVDLIRHFRIFQYY